MKTRKKTTQKPSAKQLAARRKFAAAAKARSKAARAKKSRKATPKKRNRTVIKAKRVTVLSANPKGKKSKARKPAQNKRIKVGNGYVHLAISGQAKSAQRDGNKGWTIGGKFFPVGRGTKKLTGGKTFLDLGTGYVYRHAAPNGLFSKKQTETRICKTNRITGKKRCQTVEVNPKRKPAKKRTRRNPDATQQAKQQFKEFHGYPAKGTLDLLRPDSAPASGLSVLGKLHLIKLEGGGEFQAQGQAYLCRDTQGKLHICCERGSTVYDGPAGLQGRVKQVEYQTRKPQLGHPRQTIFFHRLGEEGGQKPKLYSDGKGGLIFKGGSYYITPEGIRD